MKSYSLVFKTFRNQNPSNRDVQSSESFQTFQQVASVLSQALLLSARGRKGGKRLMLHTASLRAINLSPPPSPYLEPFDANLQGAMHSQINIAQFKEPASCCHLKWD